MAKPGFLKVLEPLALGAGALALGPEIFGAEGLLGGLGGEAAAGGAEAAAAGPSAFLIPGTDTALAGGLEAAGGAAGGLGELGASGAAGAAGAAAPLGELAGQGLADLSASLPADFTGGSVGAGNVFGLPAGADVGGESLMSAPTTSLTPPTAAAPTPADAAAPSASLAAGSPGAGSTITPASAGGFAGTGQPADIVAATSADPNLATAAYDAAGGAPTGGVEGFAGKAGDYLLSHPGAALTGLMAGSQLLKGNPPYPAETQIGNIAAGAQGEAAALTAPLTTGVLPPGEQQMVDASTKGAIAAAKSTYGNLGLSGSTMEADKVAQIKQNAAAEEAKIANDLAKTGAAYSGLSLTAYNDLLKAQMSSDKDYRDALYNFARSLSGSGYSATPSV